LRGGTFEQTLVLLNGFRIDDSQTSHHNLDLPVPLDAMDSIEVLHGVGSTLHGVDALSGVVDFLTAAPTATTLRLRAGGGSFGSEEESLLGTLARKRWSSRLTADRNFSTRILTSASGCEPLYRDCQDIATAMKILRWKTGLVRALEFPICCLPRATVLRRKPVLWTV
jgi:hypothetical protein